MKTTKLFKSFVKTLFTLVLLFVTAGTYAAPDPILWKGNVTLTNGQVINNDIRIQGNVTVNIAGTVTVNGYIWSDGTNSLTVAGSSGGKLILAGGGRSPGNQNFTGDVNVMTGITLELCKYWTGIKMMKLNTNSVLRLRGAVLNGSYTKISGVGKVIICPDDKNFATHYAGTKEHPAMTYTGGTVIEKGRLDIESGSLTGNIEVKSGAVLLIGMESVNNGTTVAMGNHISGSGEIQLRGNHNGGSIHFNDLNAYTGKITVGVGNNSPSKLILKNETKISGITLNAGSNLMIEKAGGTLVVPTPISGVGNVEVKCSNNAIVKFTADNSFTGNLSIGNGGDVEIGGKMSAKEITATDMVISSVTFNAAKDITYAGKIIAGDIIKNGKNLTLSGELYAKKLTVNPGSLTLTGEKPGIGEMAVANGGTLILKINTYTGILSGAGKVTKDGAGALTLPAANTATGVLTVENGTLLLAKDWKGGATLKAGKGLIRKNSPLRRPSATSDLKKALTDFENAYKNSSKFGVSGNNPVKVEKVLVLDGGSILLHTGRTVPELDAKSIDGNYNSSGDPITTILYFDNLKTPKEILEWFAGVATGSKSPLIKAANGIPSVEWFTVNPLLKLFGGELKIENNTLYLVKAETELTRKEAEAIVRTLGLTLPAGRELKFGVEKELNRIKR
jgi:autotransporter-associated beta strand protein